VDVRRHPTEGIRDDVPHADRRGEVKRQRVLCDERVDEIGIENGPANDPQLGIIAAACQVSFGSGREVV
jgi:hypothetical protein